MWAWALTAPAILSFHGINTFLLSLVFQRTIFFSAPPPRTQALNLSASTFTVCVFEFGLERKPQQKSPEDLLNLSHLFVGGRWSGVFANGIMSPRE